MPPDLRDAVPLTSGYVRSARLFIVAIALISLLTLFGWMFDVYFLKSPIPAITAMNPASALCFLLICFCVIPLMVVHQGWRVTTRMTSGFVLPGILILVSSIVLIQNILSLDYGLDSLIFHDKIQLMAGESISSKMGALTSFNFVLSGIVIMLNTNGRTLGRKSANVISLVILLIAVFSLTGYVYNVSEFYDNQQYRPMPIQTSISFILLSVALLFLNVQAGFMNIVSDARGGGFIARMVIPAAILVPVLMGYLRFRLQWEFPVSVELGVNFMITGIVAMLIILILYIGREINVKDRLREEAERTSEVKFKSLIENSFDAIALTNERNEITYLSPSAERMTGIRLQEDQVTQWFLLAHPEDLEVIKALFNQSLSNPGVPVPFQCRTRHAQGYYIWIEGVMTNLVNDKNIESIVANFRDITERRRHEEALEESNSQIQDILESSIDCFFTCDRNWIIHYWNKAAEEFTRIKRAEIVGKSIWIVFPLTPKSPCYQSLHRTMDEGVPTSFEDSYGDIWFGATAYPSKGGVSVFFRDITERKRLEMVSKLEKDVLEFYTMWKTAPLEETITLLLNGVQRIHPEMLCSVLRLENGRLYNWASPHLPTAYAMAIHGAAIGIGEGSCGTAAFRKQNVIVTDISNDPLWTNYRELATAHNLLACWSHVILDDDQTVLGTFAIYYRTVRSPRSAELWTIERAHVILKNIVKNQLAEERILKLNTELEDRVMKRTQQLEEANKELESFSYSVSHDLRAPLRSIQGYGNILLDDYGAMIGADGKRVLDIVVNSAHRMGVLIDDLLDFSRLGKTPLKSHQVDMNRVVKEVIQELQFQYSGNPIQWTISDLESVRCDLSLIKQVWMNLLSNAVKYSARRQSPMITIGMEGKKELITYFVKDNGAGFDMQYYNKLFGVFQRLHGVEDFPGTGVGLAIVQRIVKRHGGQVWAESEVNQGTVFYFTLPAI